MIRGPPKSPLFPYTTRFESTTNGTASTYTLVEGDENNLIRVHTSVTDDTGQTRSANNKPTPPAPDLPPSLSLPDTDDAIEVPTLPATAVSSSDEAITVSYQW